VSTHTIAPKRGLWRDHPATPAQRSLFEPSSEKPTQASLILALLREARARGVPLPLPEILKLGVAQYSARMNELRGLGYIITNTMERSADGAVHSWYRLTFDPERDPAVTP
jgi:hypothetical protein